MAGPVHAVRRFNVADRDEYLADSYGNDPKIAGLHPHRENGARDYIWRLSDKLEDLRPILK